jgi:NAD(P)-dependent dehydrogenase (short-subunit alcohol dehydrogenase family)
VVVATNTGAPMLVTKHVSRGMIAAGGGSVVNISSQASLVALPGHSCYAASKAGLDALTRVGALELGRHNVRVNSVHPTVVLTQMSADHWDRPEIKDPFLARMPLGRFATAEEIAGPVVFLLSDDAAMVNGVALAVDGGYSIC